MRPKNVPLLLAVLACNSDFVLPTILHVNNPYITTNWLILPPVLIYLALSGRINLVSFSKKALPVVIALGMCILCQLYNSHTLGEASVATLGVIVTTKQIATCLVVFLIFHELVRNAEDVRTFLTYVAFSAIINAMLLLCVAAGLIPAVQNAEGWVAGIRVTRFGLGDPNITFCYLAIGVAYWLLLAQKRALLHRRDVALAILCFAGATLPALLGLSRGALAALGLSVLVGAALLAWSFNLRTLKKYTLAAVALAILAMTQVNGHRIQLLLDRLQGIRSDFSASLSHREDPSYQRLFSVRWLAKDLLTSPDIIGKGYAGWYNENLRRDYPHFTPADIYIVGGLLAFLAFAYFVAVNLWHLMRRLKEDPDPDFRASKLALCIYECALILMILTISVAWLKIIWAAFAVMAKANQLTAERRELAMSSDAEAVADTATADENTDTVVPAGQ